MSHYTGAELEAATLRLAGRLFLGDHPAQPYSLRSVARMVHEQTAALAARFTEHGATADYRPLAIQTAKVLAAYDSLCPPV